MTPLTPRPRMRDRYAVRWLLPLVLAVVAAHLLVTDAALNYMQALAASGQEPARIRATYVSEVRLSRPRPAQPGGLPGGGAKPPAAATAPPKRSKPRRPQPPTEKPAEKLAEKEAEAQSEAGAEAARRAAADAASAASAAETQRADAAAAASAAASGTAAEPARAASAGPDASTAAAAAPAASDAVAAGEGRAQAGADDRPFGFPWPQATRIRYRLNGYARGPIAGNAQVEWLRDQLHYQVHVEMNIALVYTREIISDGLITTDGLAPKVFLEKTSAVGRRAMRRVQFDGDEVVLATGERAKAPPLTQDEASQFVQLTYRFMRDPSQLQPGRQVVMPMVRANSRKVDTYVYDVVGIEPIDTPLGRVPAAHLVPQRAPERMGRGDWVLELWFAPELEYLPIKLSFRKDDPNEQINLELLIERAPERGVAPPAPSR